MYDIKTFNVVCVSRDYMQLLAIKRDEPFIPVTGVATVTNESEERHGVTVQKQTRVELDLEKGRGVRGHLVGVFDKFGAVVLRGDMSRKAAVLDFWYMYTDTPAGDLSADDVRKILQEKIADRPALRGDELDEFLKNVE